MVKKKDAVVLFTATNCPQCQAVKSRLKKQGIHFKERNVTLDKEASIDLLMVGRCTTPTLIVNGRIRDLKEFGDVIKMVDWSESNW